MEDRRVFARIAARFPLRFLDPRSGRDGEAETVDFSANGVGFVTGKSILAKTPLELWLNIPDKHDPFYTRAEVVWSESLSGAEKYRVGVRLERAELMGLARILWLKRRD